MGYKPTPYKATAKATAKGFVHDVKTVNGVVGPYGAAVSLPLLGVKLELDGGARIVTSNPDTTFAKEVKKKFGRG
jgi:hypothetical protein